MPPRALLRIVSAVCLQQANIIDTIDGIEADVGDVAGAGSDDDEYQVNPFLALKRWNTFLHLHPQSFVLNLPVQMYICGKKVCNIREGLALASKQHNIF